MVHIQANMFVCTKSFIKEVPATREKLYLWLSLIMNIKLCYKRKANRVVVSLIALARLK